jgi:2-keto-4-pentenoate hydratase/2-oxohepta-3-ene-1,7-dioic acid hydratase in catechol pathway
VWVRQQRFVSHLDCVLPTFFNKRVSCLTGTNDPILVPYDSPMLDYEGELMAVIVKQALAVRSRRRRTRLRFRCGPPRASARRG